MVPHNSKSDLPLSLAETEKDRNIGRPRQGRGGPPVCVRFAVCSLENPCMVVLLSIPSAFYVFVKADF